MAWKLFLDDERDPVGNDWIVCRCMSEAAIMCEVHGLPTFISFDHDLGEGFAIQDYDNTGMGFLHWMIDQVLDGKFTLPAEFDYDIHSQNPIGAANIRNLLDNFLASRS